MMILKYQYLEILYILLAAASTVLASFCTRGPFSVNAVQRSRKWVDPMGPLQARHDISQHGLPDELFPARHEPFESFFTPQPSDGLDSVKIFDKEEGLGRALDFKFSILDKAAGSVPPLDLKFDTLLDKAAGSVSALDLQVGNLANEVGTLAKEADASKFETVESIRAARDSFKEQLDISLPIYSEKAGEVVNDVARAVDKSREAIFGAEKALVDKAVELYTTETTQQAPFAEFAERYSASMESHYKLSELAESISNGKLLQSSIEIITEKCQESLDALDLKQNTPVLLLVVTFFWSTIQRRDGIEYGKALSQVTIDNLKDQLKSTKDAARKENAANAAQIKDLQSKMDELQAQVETLNVASREAALQLEQAKAEASIEQDLVPPIEKLQTESPKVPSTPPPVEEAQEEPEIQPVKAVKKAPAKRKKLTKKKVTKVSPSAKSIAESEPEVEVEKVITSPKKQKGIKGSKASPAKASRKKQKAMKSVQAKTNFGVVNGVNGDAGVKTSAPAKTKVQATNDTPKKKVKKEAAATKTNGAAEPDWTSFAQSTLKRKTVKELTSYLETKGVEVTDENGKTLKKDSLVGLVLSN
ncbi:expressed unknown protein [Seminavis robusta]|uniref:Uncharacterized protein n=1 Tax=Seminavis robusta TaxID=568900 RepID=A0A9N8ECE5_9STRA|nr:expressed unknown protein [Seminavis robusta]|eukprot:Sro750_g197020.1 n/a (589) ;mRNA; f:35272-37127